MLLETSSGQVIEAIATIQRMAEQNKIGSALEEAYHSLQHAPTYLPMHIQIGELLVKEGLTHEAVNKFMLVARLYNLRGEAAQAIGLLNRVIQIAPMDQSVRAFLVELLISQENIDGAIEHSMALARNYEYLADFTKMRKVYQETLRLAQNSKTGREWSVKILYEMADLDLQRLDWHQAVRVFEQIRTMEPEDATARSRIVELNFRLRQDNVAFAELDSFVSMLESSGEVDKAVEFVHNIITDWEEKIELRRFLAELFARNNRVTEAVEQLDVVASTMLDANNQAGAIKALERIISLNPPNIADYQAALAQMKGG
jgi:tetratricopeptide (TPR) repeat protein